MQNKVSTALPLYIYRTWGMVLKFIHEIIIGGKEVV